MVITICLPYTVFRDRNGPNVAPNGTNVGVYCGAKIAHLPTQKFALGSLDSRQEGSRTTFWTEREGYVAALSTLEYMEKNKIHKKINQNGLYIKKSWKEISKKCGIKIKISGLSVIPSFNFLNNFNKEAITYLTQEMLRKKILASNIIYLSYSHKRKHLDKYLKNFQIILKKISKFKNKKDFKKNLLGKVRQSHLKRMN